MVSIIHNHLTGCNNKFNIISKELKIGVLVRVIIFIAVRITKVREGSLVVIIGDKIMKAIA